MAVMSPDGPLHFHQGPVDMAGVQIVVFAKSVGDQFF